jgi:hypothetical protein
VCPASAVSVHQLATTEHLLALRFAQLQYICSGIVYLCGTQARRLLR